MWSPTEAIGWLLVCIIIYYLADAWWKAEERRKGNSR